MMNRDSRMMMNRDSRVDDNNINRELRRFFLILF